MHRGIAEMAFISEIKIDTIKQRIINCRDFCGDEQEAANDAAWDCDLSGEDAKKAINIAFFRANKAWNGFRRQAGVNSKYITG